MKKRVIAGIVATILGVVTLSPVAASAEERNAFDVNGDGKVNTVDFVIVRHAVTMKGQIDKDGKLQKYVRGDVNGDGRLTKEDLVILAKINTENAEGMKAADANEDGKIDLKDYSTVDYAIRQNGQIDKGGEVLDYIIGDVNGDHVLNQEDIIALKERV